MKKVILFLIPFLFTFSNAQTLIYQTDFSNVVELGGTGLYTSELVQSDDYKEWMTAATFCVFENAGELILPSINIPKGSHLTITWGIHDSGRNIELQADNSTLTTFTATQTDKLVQSTYDFSPDFNGNKSLTLSINEGAVFITQITITADNESNVSNIKTAELSAWMENNYLIINSKVSDKMEITSANGQRIYQGAVICGKTIFPIILSNGIYFIRVGKNTVKVLVK